MVIDQGTKMACRLATIIAGKIAACHGLAGAQQLLAQRYNIRQIRYLNDKGRFCLQAMYSMKRVLPQPVGRFNSTGS